MASRPTPAGAADVTDVTDATDADALLARARRVRLVLVDIDGSLTEGGIFIGPHGEVFKRFSVRDGFGIRLLREAGIPTGIVTGRESEIVATRARELGIAHVLQGVRDKTQAVSGLCDKLSITLDELAFLGDDWPDLGIMRRCGLAAAPADADAEVLRLAHWVSGRDGGQGAMREFSEWLLGAQKLRSGLLASYLA